MTGKPPERRSAYEVRAEGRTIRGPAIRFGDVSLSHRERFEPGSFNQALSGPQARTLWLDREHDPNIILAYTGAGLELRADDTGLYVEAVLPELPPCDQAIADVQAGILSGLSVEFHARAERREDGLRVISQAELVGIGLVKHPSYSQSQAELRNAKPVLPVWVLS